MEILAYSLVLVSIVTAFGLWVILRHKNIDIWILSYIKQFLPRPDHSGAGPKHVMFCFVDHFEPQWRQPDIETERSRVDRWFVDYPKQAKKFSDSDGCSPKHSFFYPEEEYRKEHLCKLADLCRRGFGEIEVHLHHDDDSAENFKTTLSNFVKLLHKEHGAFSYHPDTGKLAWAFIHGNWSLCNSRKDGRFCGVNEELTILRELGCYCDMTLPSAPSDTQTTTINRIYYASNTPGKAKSHDHGVEVEVGGRETGDLMILQGPLALNFRRRKYGVLPSIENADIKSANKPTKDRVDLWVKTGVSVKGRPEWVFVKVHTHGAQDQDMDDLLSGACDEMYDYLGTTYNDGKNFVLHYVSAREMYNIVKAAEAGMSGNPNDYRDFILPKPTYISEYQEN